MDDIGSDVRAIVDDVALVSGVLAPFFLLEPGDPEFVRVENAWREIDPGSMGIAWPFGDPARAAVALCDISRGLSDSSDRVLWDYRRLFVGPNRLEAPPWGSVYTDRDGVVEGESCLALRAWMRRNALKASPGIVEDHIGCLFELVAFCGPETPELAVELLQLHLFPWAPRYFELLEQAASTSLYTGLARLAAVSVEGMREALKIEKTDIPLYR